ADSGRRASHVAQKWRDAGVATSEPIAKPAFPPRAKMLIALLELPAACRAAREPSGWNAAIPSPESAISTHVRAYDDVNPAAAIPPAAAAIPAMIIHRRGRRSPITPNTGWAMEEIDR